MAVGLFTDRRMIDHRVPAHAPGTSRAAPGDPPPARARGLSQHLSELPGPRGDASRSSVASTRPTTSPRSCSSRPRAAVCSTPTPGSCPARSWRLGWPRGRPSRRSRTSWRHGTAVHSAWSVPPATTPGRRPGWASASTATSPWPRRDALARFDLGRVLIVDFDVHHGNGTQEIFYESSRVGFLSIHRYPFYPGTGAKDETGTGDGLGSTRNIPLPYGTPRRRVSRRVPRRPGDAGRPDPARARPDQRGIRRPRRGPGRRPGPGGRGLRDPDQGDRRGRRDPRRRPDRERAGGGIQRPDPGRLRRGASAMPWEPSGGGSRRIARPSADAATDRVK